MGLEVTNYTMIAGLEYAHGIYESLRGTMFNSIAVLGGPKAMIQLLYNY